MRYWINQSRRVIARAACSACVALGFAALAPSVAAQTPGAVTIGRPQPELRVDALLATDRHVFQLGAGMLWPLGRGVRAGAVLAGGLTDGDAGGDPAFSSRADVVAHFVVRTAPTGRPRLYLGAGAGVLSVDAAAPGRDARALVHVLVGAEGSGPGWAHAVEVGLGGGVRLGVVLRRAPRAR